MKTFTEQSKESNYWLGYIAADGYIYKNYLGFNIAKRDQRHLRKFKEFMNSNNKISDRGNSVQFRVCDNILVENLQDLGIEYRKSYSQKSLMRKVPNNFKEFFIAGYFDGDGSIFSYEKKYGKYYAVSITGNKATLEDIKIFLSEKYNFKKLSIVKNGSVFRLRWDSKHDVKEFHKLYSKSPHQLSRKIKKFQEAGLHLQKILV